VRFRKGGSFGKNEKMEFYQAINNRRTIRSLEDKPIPYDVLERIVAAGMQAPTHDHRRMYCILASGKGRGHMIINTGGRTDTVQYYTEWLLNRFSEGYAMSRNPLFPNKVTRYELTPDTVDCVVFCSKNYKPILPRLHEITDRFNTYFHYTITAYGKDIEPGVPGIEESMETLTKLSGLVGKHRIVWRYDPVLPTKEYTIKRHLETYERMAKVLSPYIDRCIFSFVKIYTQRAPRKKLESNMPELIPLSAQDMDVLAQKSFRRECGS